MVNAYDGIFEPNPMLPSPYAIPKQYIESIMTISHEYTK